jgi:hypothetical protein
LEQRSCTTILAGHGGIDDSRQQRIEPGKEACADRAAPATVIAEALRDLPDYAKPRRCVILSEKELRGLDLVTANGRPRRSEIRRFVSPPADSFSLQI